jgi:hypothetical protein
LRFHKKNLKVNVEVLQLKLAVQSRYEKLFSRLKISYAKRIFRITHCYL